MNADHGHDGHGELGHIIPFAVYRNVCISLLVLTVITILASSKAGFVDFGALALVVAMLIASVKASLVALYFMHLKYENPVTWLYVGFPILLLAVLMAGIFIDNPVRHDPVEGTFIEQQLQAKEAATQEEHGDSGHH